MLIKLEISEEINSYWEGYPWMVTLVGNRRDLIAGEVLNNPIAENEIARRKRELDKKNIDYKVSLMGGFAFSDEKMAVFYSLKWSEFRL